MHIYPDYYAAFRCTADRCRHNCCIGWEIDIDGDTAALYSTVTGALGDRLRTHTQGDPPHFILDAQERCPFLNEHNLCDIITELGEEALCDICAMHPRFVNERSGRMEFGIGMACEEAARIILTKETPSVLLGEGSTDEILALRDSAIALLQDRSLPIDARTDALLAHFGVSLAPIEAYANAFRALERLDDAWTVQLAKLNAPADTAAFALHMRERETEYEQLLVYLVYRHMASAKTAADIAAYAAFAVLCYRLLYALGAHMYTENGDFTAADQIELCRMFSAEIEYSEENVRSLVALFSSSERSFL